MIRKPGCYIVCHLLFGSIGLAGQQTSPSSPNSVKAKSPTLVSATALDIEFVPGSNTTLFINRGGKQYLVDLTAREVREVNTAQESSSRSGEEPQLPPVEDKKARKTYQPGDDQLLTLPTGRHLERHGAYFNFTHRFPFESAFSGRARGSTLLGLDDVAISSFGFRFGVTDRLSVVAYRAPSFIGRPIELMASYTMFSEAEGAPLNSTIRFSVDGQNNFSRNFSTNLEWIASRSIRSRAQLYFVPTISLHNRPVIGSLGGVASNPPFQPCASSRANGLFGPLGNVHPCANTVALGFGASVDIRPTVALLAEVQPTVTGGPELGIHRAAFGFGIQKKIWRHAFTLGFTNSPGTTVSQRIGTRATYLGQPNSDTPGKVFIGFDLMRQIR
jgi:hypothetical protein